MSVAMNQTVPSVISVLSSSNVSGRNGDVSQEITVRETMLGAHNQDATGIVESQSVWKHSVTAKDLIIIRTLTVLLKPSLKRTSQ